MSSRRTHRLSRSSRHAETLSPKALWKWYSILDGCLTVSFSASVDIRGHSGGMHPAIIAAL